MGLKVEMHQNKNDAWYWNLVHTNGNVLATSESYSSKEKCQQTVDTVRGELNGFMNDVQPPVCNYANGESC